MDPDKLCWIIDDLWLTRNDVAATATRLGLGEDEVREALAYARMHGHDLFIAQADRRRSGAVRPLPPLENENPGA